MKTEHRDLSFCFCTFAMKQSFNFGVMKIVVCPQPEEFVSEKKIA